MRLHSLKIEGFRRHFNTEIVFSDATFLIGANNSGKSSVLKAIDYLLNDRRKMDESDFYSILGEDEENEQVCDKVILTTEFRNVPKEIINWRGFNKQRLIKYEVEPQDNSTESGLSIFYRKTYEPNKNNIIEMKQYESTLKEKYKNAKTIQDFLDSGLDEEVIKTYFEEKTYNQNMTPTMLNELKDIGIEDLFDVNEDETIWFQNPGGIPANVTSKLPRYLLIPDSTEKDELSGQSGALMKTLKSLFEDVRDASKNFEKAQYYLTELAKELDPEDEDSDFYQLLNDLNGVVGDVFPDTSFLAKANLSNPNEAIKPRFDVQLGSNINTEIEYQGAGIIRSAIFAMLRYRSMRENKRIQGTTNYVRPLLIAFEEPEIYLHPQAAQQMRDTIYDLSIDPNNQIICTTHSPYMIDLSKNAHQILNSLYIEGGLIEYNGRTNEVDMIFSNPFNISKAFQNLLNDDQSYVKMLLKIDDTISRIFFTKNVLIVEGDTEEVIIKETLSRMPEEMYKEFSYNWEVIRARGKATIISLVRYLKALGVNPFVIHDRDKGKPKAFEMNKHILKALGDESRIIILEECIEDLLGYKEPSSNKPYRAYQFINEKWGSDWNSINLEWRKIIEGLISYETVVFEEVAVTTEK